MACHKASVLPDNRLFLPIHVGAAITDTRLPMLRDDSGDNISRKNPSYCELTAQYWGWKQLDADYLGLCHYRRFLCFAGVQDQRNVRNQLTASSPTPFHLHKYGLEDEAQMRAVIEAADIVTGELQTVSRLYTPRGAKRTAYAHWAAHDRDLIRKEDLDRMLDILETVSPEVGASAREYLSRGQFGGFNCFVMKRELYRTLCELEFETLRRLEAQVDRTYYSTQMNRIFGFMGEIISSAFIFHMEKKGCRVRYVPLVYFENTDPTFLYPSLGKPNTISALFYAADVLDAAFSAQLQSFLEHIEPAYVYDLWVLIRARREVREILSRMAGAYPNVSLRWIDAELLARELTEQYGENITMLPLLPYAMREYSRMLVFGSSLLFLDSVAELWHTELAEEEWLAAPRDLWMVARYNDIFPQTEAQYLDQQLDCPYDYVTDRVMVWDFAKYRQSLTPAAVCGSMKNSMGALRNPAEAVNVLCRGHIRLLPQKWCVWTEGNAETVRQLGYLPLRFAQEWKASQSSPCILCHAANDPFFPKGDPVDLTFWRCARQTPLYESCLAHMSYVAAMPPKADPMEALKRRIKASGAVGGFLARTFPRGSGGYRLVQWLLRKFSR